MEGCNKSTYPAEADALIAIWKIQKYGEETGKGKPRRAYLCVHCGEWHITSKSVKQYKRNVKKGKEIRGRIKDKRISDEARYWIKRMRMKDKDIWD